jgi:hypothetical protein
MVSGKIIILLHATTDVLMGIVIVLHNVHQTGYLNAKIILNQNASTINGYTKRLVIMDVWVRNVSLNPVLQKAHINVMVEY